MLPRNWLALTVWMGFFVPGCGSHVDLCDAGGRSTIDRDDLREAVVADLAENGVPVQVSASGVVCYERQYREFVVSRIIELDLALRPANRMSIPDPELAQLAQERLAQAQIQYQTTYEPGSVVLVFENDTDAFKAVQLVSELSKSHYELKRDR